MKKGIKNWIYLLAAFCVLLILSNSCKKKDNDKSTTITDQDGNIYHTVSIGTQVWMLQNLKTKKYRNGDLIPNITDSLEWINILTGAYCKNISNGYDSAYGYLYNYYAVNDVRNIATVGWHVPSQAEWAILISYLGGEDVAGGKIRESGSIHWQSPNKGATNESGFTALPVGGRNEFAQYLQNGTEAVWWSTTTDPEMIQTYGAFTLYLSTTMRSKGVFYKREGLSIRCIKDQFTFECNLFVKISK